LGRTPPGESGGLAVECADEDPLAQVLLAAGDEWGTLRITEQMT
jgi:hypothetical protein